MFFTDDKDIDKINFNLAVIGNVPTMSDSSPAEQKVYNKMLSASTGNFI